MQKRIHLKSIQYSERNTYLDRVPIPVSRIAYTLSTTNAPFCYKKGAILILLLMT